MTLEISRSFPPDIIREILLKVATVKSLLRCKSVCKEWHSLISEQQFIRSHYSLSSTNINYAQHRLIYKTEKNDLYSCPLYDVLFDKSVNNAIQLENPLQQTQSQEVGIVGSCNGLVCILVTDYKAEHYNLFIYNPSTRIWKGLPISRRYGYGVRDYYSFGYDESTDDFKIVELGDIVQIYSLNSGKWKNIGEFSYTFPMNGCGIFSNGALHWVVWVSSRMQGILSLDLAKETYGEVLKFEYDEVDTNLSLGVLGECLCGLCYYYESHADLWVMKVYGVKDSWTKLASFPYVTDYWIDEYPVPLFISNDGIMLFQLSEWHIYGSKDSSSREIQYNDTILEACIVVESLVSPFPPLGSRKVKSASTASSTRGEPTSNVSLRSLNSKEFNAMTSESYWLSRVRESEKAAMHHISLGFFKLALEAGCQNIKQLRDELESYDCRHNLLGLGESAKQVFHSYQILKQQEKTVNFLES